MSDNWVEKYIDVHKQKQQEKENAQKRAALARAGANDLYQRIRERMQHDLSTFHTAGVFFDVDLSRGTKNRFEVHVADPSPAARLTVELDTLFIKFEYAFPKEKGIPGKSGALRIGSDFNGVLTVYRNGDSFTDESDISEFLLKPLLDYMDSQ